jgi:hypothetical protein
MKGKYLFFTALVFLACCDGANRPLRASDGLIGERFNFIQLQGKVIERIYYLDRDNNTVIHFTDKTTLVIHCYKYEQNITYGPNQLGL